MANDHDKLIRLAVKQLIKNLYPTAQVFAWNALSHDIDEWAGMFRTADDKTHGWIIKRAALSATWKNGQRDRKSVAYDVWGFYKFENGNETTNSDNDFAEITDAVYEALKQTPRLNVDEVEGHDLLQYVRLTTLVSGEETLHFAQGRLNVRLCC